ncbi:hypothetical protein COO60DRAFT_1643845 [Scenedesmus sp. NREL 46B-D3]|nr:hypothetical protein COO60DRAFT_1643845 [Scenedesmus sp. NREL 46B-D3]
MGNAQSYARTPDGFFVVNKACLHSDDGSSCVPTSIAQGDAGNKFYRIGNRAPSATRYMETLLRSSDERHVFFARNALAAATVAEAIVKPMYYFSQHPDADPLEDATKERVSAAQPPPGFCIEAEPCDELMSAFCCKKATKEAGEAEAALPASCTILQFDTTPIPVPTYYNAKQKRWKVAGTFCSWSCAKAHMLDKPRFQLASMLPLLRKHATGREIGEGLKAAPPRTALRMFGGPLSIEEFRADASTLETAYTELRANIILDAPVLTLVPSATPRSQGLIPRPLNFDHLTPGLRNETLRLKRPKPVKRKANNNMLEKIFGIANA